MAQVTLTKGKVALVSAHRFPDVSRYLWYAAYCDGLWYARRVVGPRGARRTVYLHRYIASPREGLWVDHANGDGLDCRDENLRVVPPRFNCWNTGWLPGAADYVGVDVYDRGGRRRFRARITDGQGRRYQIGIFDTAEEAARAWDAEAVRIRGEFARLNFPETPETPDSPPF